MVSSAHKASSEEARLFGGPLGPADEENIKYVLYTHYRRWQDADFHAWSQPGAPGVGHLKDLQFLSRYLPRLRELLTAPCHEGMLVVFYSAGFRELLDGVARNRSRTWLLDEVPVLRFAHEVGEAMAELLEKESLHTRVRFITPLDLYDVFDRMNWDEARQLRWWFIGQEQGTYDTPKIVEAVLRLRLLGTGVPVFRVDHDVLFRRTKPNDDLPDLGLFKAVASCRCAYRQRVDEASIVTFLFSASYDASAVKGGSTAFDDWVGAFATRAFPALPVDVQQFEPPQSEDWTPYCRTVFDPDLARHFLGLPGNGLGATGVRGLGKIGAPPKSAIISGALMCLSDTAILDLPPCSNFTFNVSWIDDHLKYALQRELRKLTTVDLNKGPLLSRSKIDTVVVEKDRDPISNLPAYVLGAPPDPAKPGDRGSPGYLSTVLWGTVVDSWVTAIPLLKFRLEDLANSEQTEWLDMRRTGPSEAALPSALEKALEAGEFTTSDRNELRSTLIALGLQRIDQVRELWSHLTAGSRETFASLWAKNEVGFSFTPYFPPLGNGQVARWQGIRDPDRASNGRSGSIETLDDLNPILREEFLMVVEDALEYVTWTLNWPRVVQVIRSIEQGTVSTDLTWRP